MASRPGLTQGEFSARIGISRAFLNQLLHGARKPGRETIFKIARVTGGAVPVEAWMPEAQPTGTEIGG